jgi:hypothetical protein
VNGARYGLSVSERSCPIAFLPAFDGCVASPMSYADRYPFVTGSTRSPYVSTNGQPFAAARFSTKRR